MPEGAKPGIFISHTSADADLANGLGDLVKKVFAGAMRTWYSSDQSAQGGIRPGEPWWETVHRELSGAAQVLAVVTPRSIGRPWIYWEAGIGSVVCEGKVSPVAFRVDIARLGPPLSYFEGMDGLDEEGLTKGILKVGAAGDLSPDPGIVATCVSEFIGRAQAALEGVEEGGEEHVPDPVSVLHGPLQNIAESLAAVAQRQAAWEEEVRELLRLSGHAARGSSHTARKESRNAIREEVWALLAHKNKSMRAGDLIAQIADAIVPDSVKRQEVLAELLELGREAWLHWEGPHDRLEEDTMVRWDLPESP
jgi:hypothetical protein